MPLGISRLGGCAKLRYAHPVSKRFSRYPFLRLIRGALSGEGGRLALVLDIARQADIVRLPMPGPARFVLTHPDDLRHVLQTQRVRYCKSRDYRVLGEFMGQGLVTSEEPRWGEDRRLLQPLFLQAAATDFRPVMFREVERLVAAWDESARNSRAVDVFSDTMRLTISVIAQRLFSQSLADEAPRIVELIHLLASHVFDRSQALVDVARFGLTLAERRARAARDELADLLKRHIEQRWQAEALPSATDEDVLVLLKRGGRRRDEAIDHLITLFAAGYDTTGNALGWCLHTLARHPELQERVVAGGEGAISPLVKETLRMFPTVPGVGREALVDDEIGEVPIPKGSTLMLFIYGLHHRDDFWPDPERFDLSRFSSSALAGAAYMPFGAGPRVCIGSHFAVQELSVALTVLLPRFRFAPCADEPLPALVPGISLAPDRRVHLRLQRR